MSIRNPRESYRITSREVVAIVSAIDAVNGGLCVAQSVLGDLAEVLDFPIFDVKFQKRSRAGYEGITAVIVSSRALNDCVMRVNSGNGGIMSPEQYRTIVATCRDLSNVLDAASEIVGDLYADMDCSPLFLRKIVKQMKDAVRVLDKVQNVCGVAERAFDAIDARIVR